MYMQIEATLTEEEQLRRLVKLSRWRRMKATMVDALRAYPEAAAAVVEALRQAEANEEP
jgi:hypothetical protein